MTMITRFPEKEAEDTVADSSHSQVVSAAVDLVVAVVAAVSVALAVAEVSAAAVLLVVGNKP